MELQDRIQSENIEHFQSIQKVYFELLTHIKDKLMENPKFVESIDSHMHEINEFLTKTYLRSDVLRNKRTSRGVDEQLNRKIIALRKSDFENMLEIPQNMKGHSLWLKAIKELQGLKTRVTPSNKLRTIVK